MYVYIYIYIYIYISHNIPIQSHSSSHPKKLPKHPLLPSVGMMDASAGPGQRPMRPQPSPKKLAPGQRLVVDQSWETGKTIGKT